MVALGKLPLRAVRICWARMRFSANDSRAMVSVSARFSARKPLFLLMLSLACTQAHQKVVRPATESGTTDAPRPRRLAGVAALEGFVPLNVLERAAMPRGATMGTSARERWFEHLDDVSSFIALPLNRTNALETTRLRMLVEQEFELDGHWYGDIDTALVERIGMTLQGLSTRIAAQGMVVAGAPTPTWEAPLSALRVTSRFGPRTNPLTGLWQFHAGVDLAASINAPVLAVAAGQVIFSGWFGGHGLCIELEHGGALRTRYSHLQSIAVDVGQRVPAGAFLGLAGETGDATGVHLHFELRDHGVLKDPLPKLNASVETENGG